MILNVDDYPPGLYSRSRILRQAGFEVREALTGRDALQLAATERPDLVLLDVNLPDMSGPEVCRRLKADPATSSVLVMHLSASSVRDSDRVRGLELGADGYLVEPVEPDELIASIHALLRVRRAEERVRQAVHEWQTTFDALHDGVCLLDRDGRMVRCNRTASRLLGKTAEELIGSLCDDVIAAAFADAERALFSRMLETARRESTELAVGSRWIEVITDPVVDATGALSGAVVILSDVTARKQAELEHADLLRRERAARDEAEAAIRAMDDFLAMLSHELRTPLNAMMGWLRVLRLTGDLDEADRVRALETIERNAEAQARLIEDLLDVSRIIAGTLRLDIGPVDLTAVVADTLNLVRPLAQAKGIVLESAFVPETRISGDESRLRQVVANLLSNAIKFTASGGRVAVSLERRDARVQISVQDTGMGIATDFLPHVFDRLRQAGSTTTRGQGGLGLSLAIVRHLVELHGGAVRADSPGPGRGAIFTVTLPVAGPPSPGR
jgi:PAS domain S-box-containing protein